MKKPIQNVDRPLTPKERLFVREYLIDLNASAACKRAGYLTKNPDVYGHQLLVRRGISSAVQSAIAEREKRLEITGDRVVQELALLAFQDVKKLYDASGNLIPIQDLPDHLSKTIAGIKYDKDGFVEVKTWDKKGSLELLGRHLKLFTDKTEHNLNINMIGNFQIALVNPNITVNDASKAG